MAKHSFFSLFCKEKVKNKSKKMTRLRKRKDFLKISEEGVSAVKGGIILQSLKRESSAYKKVKKHDIRVGFTATKKLGNAVIRNRIKRRLRVLAREIIPSSRTEGYDFVLIGRHSTLDKKFCFLQSDLKKVLRDVLEKEEE